MKKKQSSSESKEIYGVSSRPGFWRIDSGWHRWMRSLRGPWRVHKDFILTKAKGPCQRVEWWRWKLWNDNHVEWDTVPLIFLQQEKPRGTGIYLDYDPDMGKISSYSLNDRSHIHSFTDKLSEVLTWFTIRCNLKPLTICARTDYER